MADLTASDRLRNFEIAHQVRLLRMSAGESARLQTILQQTDERLERFLNSRKRKLAGATAAQRRILQRQVRELMKAQAGRYREAVNAIALETASAEVEVQAAALDRVLAPINMESATIGVGQAVAAARSVPATGQGFAQLISRANRNDAERVWNTVSAGLTSGFTNDEIARDLVGTRIRGRFTGGVREVTRRAANTLVRTVNTHVTAQARESLWSANDDVIKGVQWVSTLDGRTTLICINLDGTVWPVNEGPRPPAHPNCRSVTTPILRGLEDIANQIGATRASSLRVTPGTTTAFDGQVPATLTYPEWLKQQPASFQNEVLGKTKAKLFRAGADPGRFQTDAGRPFTLPELRSRAPELFEAAGI